MAGKPEFPVKVKYSDGEEVELENEMELACDLEFFDSEHPEEDTLIFDRLGREVILKIEKLELIKFELKKK